MTDTYYAIDCRPATASRDGAVITTICLSGEFDLGACPDLRAALLGVLATGLNTCIVVDLTHVTFIDSETVRVLFEVYGAAQKQGLGYRLVNARGVVKRVLEVIGLTGLLQGEAT